ncbi:MAG: TonB-dependent receptor [Acidobacteria bacterium]|nr:TonB-dependent receptor [Acidobacteriota bacterium]
MRTSITVTERVSTEAPASITVLGTLELRQPAGVNLDDRLRLVPGFSLFRRASSLAANPTTQGVSLRGLGSTGASRTLVLWDGVPLNSPFGGWVYWTRVNPEETSRVEVSRGASTSVFGDKAMGGSIGLFSPEARSGHGWLGYSLGNERTHQLEGAGALGMGSRWALSGSGRGFTTDGYYIVPAAARGPVDTQANVRFAAGTARADWMSSSDRLFLRADFLAEERENGTTQTRNSTGLGTLAANYTRQQGASTYTLLGFHNREEYRATFSSIGAGRQTERLTSRQSVPAESSGTAGMWRRAASRWNFLAGGDYHRAEGYSRETIYPAGLRVGGGLETQYGFFGQGDAAFGRLRLFGGIRGGDAGNGQAFWSPSGGAALGFERWRLRASAYRAFRAPTLNELYREFRVGNTVTLANPALRPEALRGVEAGIDYVAGPLRLSLTTFDNRLDDLITNVTRTVTPALITRQRANAAAARARGVEASTSRSWGAWRAEVSYQMVDSRYAGGARVPQIAKNQGSTQVSWSRRSTLIAGGLRASALQLEDDLNLFVLPGFAVFHVTARQSLGRGLSLTVALENAFNRVYAVGYSPTPLTGAPRLWRAGLRWAR